MFYSTNKYEIKQNPSQVKFEKIHISIVGWTEMFSITDNVFVSKEDELETKRVYHMNVNFYQREPAFIKGRMTWLQLVLAYNDVFPDGQKQGTR